MEVAVKESIFSTSVDDSGGMVGLQTSVNGRKRTVAVTAA